MIEIFPGITFNDWIKFDVHPTSVIGTSYSEGVQLLAVLDGASVMAHFDPMARHHAVLPHLPVPVDYGYAYIKVKLANGNIDVVGLPWIKGDVIKVGSVSLTLTFQGLSSIESAGIVEMVSSAGYIPTQVISN